MDVKLKIELSNGGRVVSLDEFTKMFLGAIQRAVRQEVQRFQIPSAPPEEPATASVPESQRALAVSKAEAARILGVSRRTSRRICTSWVRMKRSFNAFLVMQNRT